MQFRFIDKDNKLLGYCNIDDYAESYKLFEYMAKNECQYCVQCNTEDVADTEGDYYTVKDVSFVFSKSGGELLQHFQVCLEECY